MRLLVRPPTSCLRTHRTCAGSRLPLYCASRHGGHTTGWVAERSIAHAWKACLPKGNGGSNPPPSAPLIIRGLRRFLRKVTTEVTTSPANFGFSASSPLPAPRAGRSLSEMLPFPIFQFSGFTSSLCRKGRKASSLSNRSACRQRACNQRESATGFALVRGLGWGSWRCAGHCPHTSASRRRAKLGKWLRKKSRVWRPGNGGSWSERIWGGIRR